jgi:type IV pilus assembly protein PilO
MNMMNLLAELRKDQKKMVIIAALVTITALFAYFRLLFMPQVSGLFSTVTKVNKLKTELKNAAADISRISEMRAAIASYDEKIGRYGDLLPTETGIPTLLESLSEMARSSGMKIVSIVPVEDRENKARQGQAYQAIPIMMSVRAGYHELGKFFSTLEDSERFIKIADIHIKSTAANPKKHDVELLVLTYILLEGK